MNIMHNGFLMGDDGRVLGRVRDGRLEPVDGLADQPALVINTGTGDKRREFRRGYSHFVGPGSSPFRGEPFEEEMGGNSITAAGTCPVGYDRSITPESLLADGCIDPAVYVCDKARSLPPWLANARASQMQRYIDDYTQVGVVGQLRATLEQLYALGQFQSTRVPGVNAGNDFTSSLVDPAISVGFRLDWGVSLLNFAPFDMRIVSANAAALGSFIGGPSVDADRDFTIRVGQVSGGSIYVPWAVRVAPGMSIAQQVLALAQTVDNITAINVSVVDLPPVIAANFSMTVTLLTAFHPVTGAYAIEYGAYNAGE